MSKFDASSKRYKTSGNAEIEQTFDGDGQRIKQTEDAPSKKRYYVNSSVLGIIYEIEQSGTNWVKKVGMVYLNGQQLAMQNSNQTVWWFYENPATGSTRGSSTKMKSEPDPLGVNNRTSAPIEPPDTSGSVPDFILPQRIVDPSNMANGCQWGGLPISCDAAGELHENETWVLGAFNIPSSAITVNQGAGSGSSSDATTQGIGGFGVPPDNAPQFIRGTRGTGAETESHESLHFLGLWQTQKTPLSKNDVNHLRKDIKDIASDELCNSFITSVLKTLSSTGQAAYETTDIFKLFEEVFANEKNTITWENISANGTTRRGNSGKQAYVKIALQIDHFGVSRGLFGSDKRSHFQVADATNTVVHELIHAYGKNTFGHQAMAEAAQSAAAKLWGKANALPNLQGFPNGGLEDALSKYFGDYLWKACYRGFNGKRK